MIRKEDSYILGQAARFLWLVCLLSSVCQQTGAQSCEHANWPVFSGGRDGEEEVRCFVYDPLEKLVIVGGVTNSADYAPTDQGDDDG